MVYWLCFFIFSVLSTSVFFSERNYLFQSFIIFVFIVLFTSLRFGTGTDFHSYINIWNTFSSVNDSKEFDYYLSNIELGYKYLIFYLSKVSHEDFWFLFVNACLSLGLSYFGLYRIRNHLNINSVLSTLILFSCFLIPYSFNAMRQAIAMGIFIFAIKDILDRSFLRVLSLSFLASLFHSSGTLIIICYFLCGVKGDKIKVSLLMAILGVAFYISGLTKYIFHLFGSQKFTNFASSWGEGTITGVILRLAIFLFILYFYRIGKDKSNSSLEKLIVMYSFGLFLYFSFYESGMLASRLNMFIRYLELILLPAVLLLVPTRTRLFGFVFIVLSCFLQLLLASSNPDNDYILNRGFIF